MVHFSNLIKRHKILFMIFGLVALTFVIVPETLSAQSALKISSLDDIKEKAKEGSDTMKDIAMYVIGGVLAVALVYVIYAVSSNNPHGKEYFLGWIVAIIIYLVALLII